MAKTRPSERLTASDLFLLLWNDYGCSTDIGGLAILDGSSLLDRDGRVRIEAVRRRLEPVFAKQAAEYFTASFPQRAVPAPLTNVPSNGLVVRGGERPEEDDRCRGQFRAHRSLTHPDAVLKVFAAAEELLAATGDAVVLCSVYGDGAA